MHKSFKEDGDKHSNQEITVLDAYTQIKTVWVNLR